MNADGNDNDNHNHNHCYSCGITVSDNGSVEKLASASIYKTPMSGDVIICDSCNSVSRNRGYLLPSNHEALMVMSNVLYPVRIPDTEVLAEMKDLKAKTEFIRGMWRLNR